MKWFSAFSLTSSMAYLLMGLWPLLDLAGFRAVTHSHSDEPLLLVAGLLLALVGLISFSSIRRSGLEVGLLGVASVVGLAGLDLRELFSGGMQGVLILHSLGELALARRS